MVGFNNLGQAVEYSYNPTIKTNDYTVVDADFALANNKSGSTATYTLPTASAYTNRMLLILNYQAFTVVSASSNVVPQTGASAGTAILAATAGKWAMLCSNGTNWVIVMSN